MSKVLAHQALSTVWADREILREKGQFWTPSWVASAMAAYVAQGTDLVFDPATGTGAFFKALLKLEKSGANFYGIDIDADVLADPVYAHERAFVEKRDFIKNPPQRKFKAIVANPPYIRHHRIDTETKAFLRRLALAATGRVLDGRAGYHVYFFVRALSLLEPGGRLAFIMPADTCEGKFARDLWQWISENFCVECAVTFGEAATPFPNVDTNAVVFFIRNKKPANTLLWVRAGAAWSSDLLDFVSSGFTRKNFETLHVATRRLDEAVSTGLSREPRNQEGLQFHLHDFATVMRGVVTGANDFFFMTSRRAKELGIPVDFLTRAVGRTRDAAGDTLTPQDIDTLDQNNRPTFLFNANGHAALPEPVVHYLKKGEELGLPAQPLIKQRTPWYKTEKRRIPPILFAYLGRRNTRFIKNDAGVIPLTGFLCVYPLRDENVFVENLWRALNHPDTLENLKLVGKSYGSGAIKVEPGNLAKLPLPAHVMRKFNLHPSAPPHPHGDLFDT